MGTHNIVTIVFPINSWIFVWDNIQTYIGSYGLGTKWPMLIVVFIILNAWLAFIIIVSTDA